MLNTVSPKLIYHRAYNIGAFGLERLHPFDSRKYGRAYRLLRREFGRKLRNHVLRPAKPATTDDLLLIHTHGYLQSLRDSANLAAALEVAQLRRLPAWIIDRVILRPMRWATAGTILGAREALNHRLVFNLSGGYHHAGPEMGEGFSIYNDIAIAIASLRQSELIAADERVIYVDCDAHQGNGVCNVFFNDPRVFIFDCYNPGIYPAFDVKAKRRIDCHAKVMMGTNDAVYLSLLKDLLPPFLDAVTKTDGARLAIYNAGTDVFTSDPLGCLNVSAAGILKRDQFVIDELLNRGLNVLVLPSGGYTRESYRLIAATIACYLHR